MNRLGLFFFLFACGKFSSSLFEKNLKMTKTVVLVTSTRSHKGQWLLAANLKNDQLERLLPVNEGYA